MTSRRLSRLAVGAALLAPTVAVASVLPPAASAVTPAPVGPVDVGAALGYLDASQQSDGGFDLSGFPGFETPDVIHAVAAAATVGGPWDPAVAAAAVRGFEVGGRDPFDAIDALVDGVAEPEGQAAGAQAAKIVALVAGPTGQSATDFDPAGNSAEPVDLLARMDRHRTEAGGYDFGAVFNGALYAALALDATGRPIPAGLVAQIRAGQREDGSWNYAGDLDPENAGEPDTTSLAVLALSAAGLDTTDPTVADAVAYLAGGQQPSGAWQAFGADDPNSTSMAVLALSAVQIDVTDRAWAVPFGVAPAAAYVSPYAWLAGRQLPDGRVASPNDDFGINTFPTAQTVQAVSAQWHLRTEQVELISALADALASSSAAARSVGHAIVGPNVSHRPSRERTAHAVAMSQPGRETAAEALFQRAFERGLDPSGRAYWSAQLVRDSRSRVLVRLTGSAEFYARSGSTTAGYVDNAYRAVLGRSPDTAGQAYWSQRLDAGEPVSTIAADLVASREYRAREVDLAYQQMLGRAADTGGRDFWTERLATTRVEAILAGIGGSAEFYQRHA
jgi:hypothetical protein